MSFGSPEMGPETGPEAGVAANINATPPAQRVAAVAYARYGATVALPFYPGVSGFLLSLSLEDSDAMPILASGFSVIKASLVQNAAEVASYTLGDHQLYLDANSASSVIMEISVADSSLFVKGLVYLKIILRQPSTEEAIDDYRVDVSDIGPIAIGR